MWRDKGNWKRDNLRENERDRDGKERLGERVRETEIEKRDWERE